MFRFFGQYVAVKSVILVFSEMFLIVSSLYIAFWLRFRQAADVNAYIGQEFFAFKVSTILAVCFICFYYNDLYDLNIVARRWELMIRLAQALGAACLVL